MDTTKVWMHDFEINIRVETGYQDVNVISECLGGDCYGLRELSTNLTPKVVFDIGGHIGAFGLMAKKIWPDCELIAVEPCRVSCELYRKNLEDNGFEGTILHKAIGYDPSRTKLMAASRTTGGGVVLSDDEIKDYSDNRYRMYSPEFEEVDLITLDELAEGFDVIDLAKIDCEGAEIDAFREIGKEAAAKFRTIVGEYHLWGDGKRILKASPMDEMAFWEKTRRSFPHLLWSWTNVVDNENKYGKFQAWPKKGKRK